MHNKLFVLYYLMVLVSFLQLISWRYDPSESRLSRFPFPPKNHKWTTGRRLIGLSPGFRLPMDSLCVSWPYAHLPGHSNLWLSWQTTHLSRLSSVKVTREGWAREDHGVVLESLNMCCRVIIYAIKSFWNSNCMVSFQLPLFFRLEFRGLAESRSRYDRYLEILYDK